MATKPLWPTRPVRDRLVAWVVQTSAQHPSAPGSDMLLSLLAVTSTFLPAQVDPEPARRFPGQAFSIAAPGPKWSVQDGSETPSGFHVNVSLRDAGGLVAASVLTLPVPLKTTASSLLEKSLAGLPGRKEYLEHQALPDRRMAGQDSKGARVEWKLASGEQISIVQRYVVFGERAYLLQAHAPLAQWDQHWPQLDACFDSFQRIEPTAEDEAAMAIPRLAARCGSEAAWAKDWDDAQQQAEDTGRHMLIVVRSYPGFELPDSTAISTFMDEDVLAFVRTRLIPLRLAAGDPAPIRDPASYGMGPSTFGVALLLVNAEGVVLADTPHVDPEACLPWLRAQLMQFPEPASMPEERDPIARAGLHLDRGELELAERTLAELTDKNKVRGLELRARLHRLRHEGDEALAALGAARLARPEVADSIDCERAFLLLREGRIHDARQILEPSIEQAGANALPKALLLMASIEQLHKGVDAARPWRVRLTTEHPESRWAWSAAVMLENESILRATKARGALDWPRPEVLAFLHEPPAAPKGASHGDAAQEEGMRWLIEHQSEDGSWPYSTDLRRAPATPPNAIGVAIDALATRALFRGGPDARPAAEAGLAFLHATDKHMRSLDLPVVFMDYTAWSCWAQLELIADLLASQPRNPDALRALGSRLVSDLEERVRGNGGWSYYLSGDAEGATAVEQSISFTTAAAVIGLIRARDAGIDVPPALIGEALDCLEAMRADTGLYAYMLYHPGGRATHNPAPGSAGRGPACELALRLGGRSSEDRLIASLDLFVENAPALAGEVGKALMHAGADSQGCHYPLFDYMMAARAAAELPEGQRQRYQITLLDLLMGTRLADGSFQDTPIMGRAYGTAATLLSLQALGQ